MAVSDFLIDTDHYMDMIVATYEGSVTIDSADGSAYIQHGLPFVPLVGGLWSNESSFSTSHDFSDAYAILPNGTTPPRITISATSSQIIITSSSAGTFYYKIYAFAPPDFNGAISNFRPLEATTAFRMNTDYNYLKEMVFDKEMLGPQGRFTYSHNLGYIPTVDVWLIYTSDHTTTGSISQVTPTDQLSLRYDIVTLTDSTLQLKTPGSIFEDRPDGYYYRIYYDEAQ